MALLTLPDLPYAREALEPHMSRETLGFHYGKHHRAYVDKTNELIRGTEFEAMALEDIIRSASGKLFNNAAQAWNHTFFWNCLTPRQTSPAEELAAMLEKKFGSIDDFKKQFADVAVNIFGSGWAWLVRKADGTLGIVGKQGAGNPLTSGQQPLLTCDVWEHAYYIDYRNARAEYVERYWRLVNWDFVLSNLHKESPAVASASAASREQRSGLH